MGVDVEGQDADGGRVTGVEQLALAVWRDSENLPFVAGGYIQSAVRSKREIPDVFGLGIEEDSFFAGGRYAINLAVGRRGDIQRTFGVEGDGLGDEIARFKNRCRLACPVAVKAEDFCGRTACRVKSALGVDAQGPKIGCVCVSDQRKFWRKLEATVAAHGYTVRSALEKVFVGGLAPGARVLGTCGGEVKEGEEGKDVKDAREILLWRDDTSDALSMTALHVASREWWHWALIEFAGSRKLRLKPVCAA